MNHELVPTDQDKKIAATIFRQFSKLPGAQHMASKFALAYLSRLLFHIQPKVVLEYGAGIGTITKLLLDHPTMIPTIVSTEHNAFCLKALENNIGSGYRERWRLVKQIDELLALKMSFDFVIFDGVFGDIRRYSVFEKGTWCFVEGNREPTRVELSNYLKSENLDCTFTSHIEPPRLQFGKKKIFGFLPRLKYRTLQGCHFGLVAPRSSS